MRCLLDKFFVILVLAVFIGCSSLPTDVVKTDALPDIYPDYVDVTIPADIAPLNFSMNSDDIDLVDVTIRGSKGGEIHANGEYADFDIDDWHQLVQQNKGGLLTVTVCSRKDCQWTQYQDFNITISQYDLDEFGVTYRRIAPGYEVGGDIGIFQRDIHTFDEYAIMQESALQIGRASCRERV